MKTLCPKIKALERRIIALDIKEGDGIDTPEMIENDRLCREYMSFVCVELGYKSKAK